MMWLYLANGQRTRALPKQYKVCRQVLAEELGLPPMAETQALHAAILNGVVAQQAAVYAAVQSHHRGAIDAAAGAAELDKTRTYLHRVIQLLDQAVETHQSRSIVKLWS